MSNLQSMNRKAHRSRRKLRLWIVGFVIVAASLTLPGCPGVTPTPPPQHTLSGQIFDNVNGRPVYGAVVTYGPYEATTDLDGLFSMALGQETGAMIAGFGVRADGYFFDYFPAVSLDAASDPDVVMHILPLDSSAYTTHTLSGRIYENPPGPTEIADSTTVVISVLNDTGGANNFLVGYDSVSGGYSVEVSAFGSDTLVAAQVDPSGLDPFIVMQRQVDLSGATTVLDLTEDPTSVTTVAVTGDKAGNQAQLTLVTPYGTPYPVAPMTLTGGSDPMDVTNPFSYPGSWLQAEAIANTPVLNYKTTLMSSSLPASIGTSVTLPATNLALAPTGAPDVTTLSYTGGTFSITPVAGTNLYVFIVVDILADAPVGMILSDSASVSFPPWLRGRLAGKTYAVFVQVVGMDSVLDIDKAAESTIPGGLPRGVAAAIVQLDPGPDAEIIEF